MGPGKGTRAPGRRTPRRGSTPREAHREGFCTVHATKRRTTAVCSAELTRSGQWRAVDADIRRVKLGRDGITPARSRLRIVWRLTGCVDASGHGGLGHAFVSDIVVPPKRVYLVWAGGCCPSRARPSALLSATPRVPGRGAPRDGSTAIPREMKLRPTGGGSEAKPPKGRTLVFARLGSPMRTRGPGEGGVRQHEVGAREACHG